MFVGATRRIVASLSLDECITHRKERVARALLEEIAPILAGQGELSDSTTQGWGLVVDTIEIQNVRVLSAEVFERLQAPYRERLNLDALRAKEGVQEEQARIALARKRADEQARREMMVEEEVRVLAERAREAAAAQHREELADATLTAQIDRRRREAEAEAELERARLEVRRQQGEMEAALAKLEREGRGDLTERQLDELMLTQTLPTMAEAFRGSFERVSLNVSSGGAADLFAFLSSGIEHVTRATRAARERA